MENSTSNGSRFNDCKRNSKNVLKFNSERVALHLIDRGNERVTCKKVSCALERSESGQGKRGR